MWHVSNEFGGGNPRCHCPVSNDYFRAWVADRYADIEAVNDGRGIAVTPAANVSPGVEAVRRTGESLSYLFLINHRDQDGWAKASGVDLLTHRENVGLVKLKAGSVPVIRE
jgi:beta-galactosidase GanA